jgi:hypothetical protein
LWGAGTETWFFFVKAVANLTARLRILTFARDSIKSCHGASFTLLLYFCFTTTNKLKQKMVVRHNDLGYVLWTWYSNKSISFREIFINNNSWA